MKKTDFLGVLAVFLGLFIFAALPATADVTKARPAEPENFQENLVEKAPVLPAQLPQGAQTEPNKTIAATETPADKNVPSSPDPQTEPCE